MKQQQQHNRSTKKALRQQPQPQQQQKAQKNLRQQPQPQHNRNNATTTTNC